MSTSAIPCEMRDRELALRRDPLRCQVLPHRMTAQADWSLDFDIGMNFFEWHGPVPLLDTSPEHYPTRGPDRTTVTPWNVGDKAYLRVELQTFWRLPRSNAPLFPIRCYLIKLEELVTVPKWARRLPRVLKGLPQELVGYKGLTRHGDAVVSWLSQFDDGASTSPGGGPD